MSAETEPEQDNHIATMDQAPPPTEEAKPEQAPTIYPQVAAIRKKMGFIGGEFLDSTAVPERPGIELTVSRISKDKVKNPRTQKEDEKWVLYFDELPDFGMVMGAKCNRKMAMARLGESSRDWPGRKLVIYRDPEVKFGGRTVGGIRIA